MTKVLITGIGGDIAQGVATILRERFPSWHLVGADIHVRHGGALFTDTLFVSPRATEPQYAEWLADVCAREQIELCIPMSEAELIRLASDGASSVRGVQIVAANARAIEVGSDKLLTARMVAESGCAAPWTVPAEEFDPVLHLPCVFKPRRSAGSKGVFVCHTADEVYFHRNHCASAVLQELLLPADREVTCAVFRDGEGQTHVLQLLRTLVGGFTGWAQVIDDPDVVAQCTRIATALHLRGSVNVQLRVTNHGPRVFEINPRFSSTALMRHRMGFEDVIWSIDDALGRPRVYHVPPTGMTAVRVQGTALLSHTPRKLV